MSEAKSSVNPAEYEALVQGAGFAPLARDQIEITGKDRVQLLNGLCTNDIKRLRPGHGCEAFLTNAQGKVTGFVYVFCREESLVLESPAGEAAAIISHLDRYVVREDVQFQNRAEEWRLFLVSGARANELVQKTLNCEPHAEALHHATLPLGEHTIAIRRTRYAGGNSLHLSVPQAAADELLEKLHTGGGTPCRAETVDVVRIEAGTPIFGRDISAENLPQEVGRGTSAISFTKGCYLGQETVARIDALGHVNWLLRGLRFEKQQVPPAGGEIELEGRVIGRLQSSCLSPQLGAPLALAYVRRGQHEVGTRIETTWGTAVVVELPLPDLV